MTSSSHCAYTPGDRLTGFSDAHALIALRTLGWARAAPGLTCTNQSRRAFTIRDSPLSGRHSPTMP